jgi:hypothetical protein
MRRPPERAPPRAAEAVVVIRPGAQVARLAVMDHARVAPRQGADDLRRRVGAGVVADHQLEIGEVLREDRADRGVEMPLAVADRQADADGGRSAACGLGRADPVQAGRSPPGRALQASRSCR